MVAALAPALMWNGASAGVLTADNLPTMTWSVGGPAPATWEYRPTLDMFAPAASGGYQMTSSPTFGILGGQAQLTIQTLSFDPDPFVLNNILVTNNSAGTLPFSAFVGLPTTFGGPNLLSGVIEIGIIDGGNDGATMATTGGFPIYQAQIDGVTVATMLDDPFSLTAGSAGVNTITDSFGPNVSGVAVTSTIGIQLRFTLSPGDTVSILSRFDVVAVPAPGAVSLLGIAALCFRGRGRGRRRRA